MLLWVKIFGVKECIACGCEAASVGTSGPEGKHGPSLSQLPTTTFSHPAASLSLPFPLPPSLPPPLIRLLLLSLSFALFSSTHARTKVAAFEFI